MNITERRKQLQLTLRDVAAAVGVSAGTVSRWESGEISNMRRDKIEKLAEVLRLSPLEIMGFDPQINDLAEEAKKIIDRMSPDQIKAFIALHGDK